VGQKKRKQVDLPPLKHRRLEALVDAAFGVLEEVEQEHETLIDRVYSMPPDLLAIQIADGPQRSKPRSQASRRKAEQRKQELAADARTREAQYKAMLAQYETAAAVAGIDHDPYMPRPDLTPVPPGRGKSAATEPTCLEKAAARLWEPTSPREVRGGLPSLGKRR
jgi:hypothetical protein